MLNRVETGGDPLPQSIEESGETVLIWIYHSNTTQVFINLIRRESTSYWGCCMRTVYRVLLLSFIALGLSAALQAQAVYRLPDVANGNNEIRTTFIFVNNGLNDATVTLTLTNQNGEETDVSIEGLDAGAAKTFNLPAGESRFYSTNGQGDLFVGGATVQSTEGIGVSAVYSLLNNGGADIMTEAGVADSSAVTEFTMAVDTMLPTNTGVAVFNVGNEATTLTFRLYRADGTLFDTRSDITLAAKGQLSQYVSGPQGIFPDANNIRGRLIVTSSTTQVSALTLRQNAQLGTPLTTLPAVPTSFGGRSFNLAQVANGVGELGIKTQFIIFSLGPPANVHLSLHDENGDPFSVQLSNGQSGSELDLQVPAEGALFVETDGAGPVTTGSAQVNSDVPVGMTSVFSLLNAQGAVTVEAGVGDSPVAARFTVPVDTTAGFHTGVALANPSDSEVTSHFVFFKTDGTITQGPDETIPAHGQLAAYVDQVFSDFGFQQGQLAVRSTAPVAAIALRQQISTGNLTTLPNINGIANDGSTAVPSNSNLVRKRITGLDFSADTTLDVELPPGFVLSGPINLPSQTSAPFGVVQAVSSTGEIYTASPGVDMSGFNYSMVVPAGSYNVRVCSVAAAQENPINVTFALQSVQGVVVDQDTNLPVDVNAVALHTVAGTVDNLAALPVDPASVSVFLALSSEQSRTQTVFGIGGDGSFSLQIGDGSYTASLIFGQGQDTNGDGIVDVVESATLLWNVGSVTVNGSDVNDVALTVPDLATLSGTVSQPDTTDFSTTIVSALNLNLPTNAALTQCFPLAGTGASFGAADTNGDYSMTVQKNTAYDVAASVPATDVGTDTAGTVTSPLPGTNRLSFSQDDDTLNISVPAFPPVVTLSGTVTDPTGAAVSGATVTVTTAGGLDGTPNAAFSASATTDASGNYSLHVLSGMNYTVDVQPPTSSSGFPL